MKKIINNEDAKVLFGNPKGIAIIQPSVGAQRLRWVNVNYESSTLKGLNQNRRVAL